MTERPFLRVFVTPAALCAVVFLLAMAAILQYSLRAFIPGSLEPGGLTGANFVALLKPLYAWVFIDTVWICFLTAFFTLLVGYPLAYALVHARTSFTKSVLLIVVVTPLFLGEVVRTYSWIIVLGNNGFINIVLLKLGLIGRPVQLMFTRLGVVMALVHVTLPVMVIMIAAALSHIDRDYRKAAESLGAGPTRAPDHLRGGERAERPGKRGCDAGHHAGHGQRKRNREECGRVNMISNMVYQLGFASFNFPFAASLCVSGLILTSFVLYLMRLAAKPLERIEPH
jgi:putative spermidine/putrescine transport system permease protein